MSYDLVNNLATQKNSTLSDFIPNIEKPKIIVHKITNISNPFSVHGIYPYRGKISAVDAFNIVSQLQSGKKLLDPFCGTGTIIYEGNRCGLDVVGVDNNPLANIIIKGKMDLKHVQKEEVLNEVTQIIAKATKLKHHEKIPKDTGATFHPKTADEIMKVHKFFNEMSDYLKSVFCGAVCVAARGCNNYLWTSTTVGKAAYPKRYINFYEKLSAKAKKHFFKLKNDNSSTIFLNDSRKLSKFISKSSIDYVFTSPPYFDALDYTAYYGKLVLSILGFNRLEIKKQLIQSTKSYKTDMMQVLSEIDQVTTNKSLIIFVVGDKKINKEIINGGDFFSNLLHHPPNKIIERKYSGSASQVFDRLNKTSRKEQIVVWDKSTW